MSLCRPMLLALTFAWALGPDPSQGSPSQCIRNNLTAIKDVAPILADHALWLKTRDGPQPSGHRADLSFRDLTKLKLTNADLRKANLHGAKLEAAVFDGARLDEADLSCVQALDASFLGKVNLFQANLTNAALTGAHFKEAILIGADLSGADLTDADFSGADFGRATMAHARLINTGLADSKVDLVDVEGTIWQPKDAPKSGIGALKHLDTVRLDNAQPDSVGMGMLLKALRDAGADEQARDLSSAKGRAETQVLWRRYRTDGDWNSLAAASFRTMVWELPTEYGRSPFRALRLAGLLCLIMIPAYARWGFRPGARTPGICLVTLGGGIAPRGRGLAILDDERVRRLQPAGVLNKLKCATFFSALTGIRFGFGSFNLLEALKKLFHGERDLVAIGRLGWVAACHSVISTVLIFLSGFAFSPFG